MCALRFLKRFSVSGVRLILFSLTSGYDFLVSFCWIFPTVSCVYGYFLQFLVFMDEEYTLTLEFSGVTES